MMLFRWIRILNLHSVIFVKFFYRFREHNLKTKPNKCVLFKEQVEYLGCLVSHKGVTLGSEHVQVIRDWPVLTIKQELQSHLGFANYHWEYIKNYALLVQPLQQLVNESKSGPIQLDQCHLDVIENIRDKLCNAPIFPYTTQITHSFLIVMPVKLQLALSCFNLLMVQKKLLRSGIVLLERRCWQLFVWQGNFDIICWGVLLLFVQTIIVLHGLWA